MNRLGEMLTKHRNTFLLMLLISTLLVSGYHAKQQGASATVDIPVTATASQTLSPLESYRQQRNQDAISDINALEKLISQSTLDENTRDDAVRRLEEIITSRQAQSALEGALVGSSLSPCVAVVAGDSLTIVTEKGVITDKDSALVMTLAAAHAGIAPENVRIITAE